MGSGHYERPANRLTKRQAETIWGCIRKTNKIYWDTGGKIYVGIHREMLTMILQMLRVLIIAGRYDELQMNRPIPGIDTWAKKVKAGERI